MVIEKGALVAGRYRLIEQVGSGAMGVVWKAQDERLGRIVAIKRLVVRYGLSDTMTEEVRRRAMREARIAARLQHRNAIALFDVAEDKGDPILVMEFLPSKSLSVVLSERGTLPPHEAAEIGAQVAEAIAAAHAVGIAHRDIKPGNILLSDNGTVKITDFGISRALDDGTVTTQTGMLAGTPAYLAPEIARGDNSTRASDVYSLGSTLYHAIEGRPPFGTNSNPLALLHAVASGNVPPPKNAGPLEPTLMSLMRVDPGERPSMKEAAEALATAATLIMPAPSTAPKTPPKAAVSVPALLPVPPQPTAALPKPQSQPSSTQSGPSKRNMAIVGLVALVVLAGTLVTVLILNNGGGKGNNDNPAQGGGSSTTQQAGAPPSGGGGSTTATTKESTPQDDSSTSETPSQVAPPAGVFIDWSEAGQFMIDYYGNGSPEQRWAMLSPYGQALFGSQEAFTQYWAQYPNVSSEDASVKENPDGSRDVTCTVTYAPGQTTTKTVRVTMIGDQLKIDSEAK